MVRFTGNDRDVVVAEFADVTGAGNPGDAVSNNDYMHKSKVAFRMILGFWYDCTTWKLAIKFLTPKFRQSARAGLVERRTASRRARKSVRPVEDKKRARRKPGSHELYRR